MNEKNTYDVIVVGAGSVGTPAAMFLAAEGLRVLLLEGYASPGQGSNKAAIGGVRATHSDPAKILLCQKSLEVFTTWEERTGVDVGWKPGGYCFPVYTGGLRDQLQGILPMQKKFGLDIDWLDADGIAQVVPGIERRGLLGGTLSPRDGQVSTLKASVAFQREGQRLGVDLHVKEPVVGYAINAGRIEGVRTEKNIYFAPRVVIATGADAIAHGRMLNTHFPVTPDSHEAGISAPVEQFLPPLVVDMHEGPEGKTANFYFGQVHSGQIIFCYTPKKAFLGHNRENLSEFMPVLASRLTTLIPRLRNLLIRRTWRGLYPMTPDGRPILDWVPGAEGALAAVGMCGQGFMLGPGVAAQVTAMIMGRPGLLPPEILSTLSLSRNFGATPSEALA
ncbi:FAD-binding oxidoreductase [Myxococcota bacterium]|nr:FAD-binding oxidoreductase [Myxococcota bacterium]MBU1410963.1 FAD-binding oxidoreductase [Myxococcota bacterium]MBU1512195.1 FAD-binding oxidoreductase [Myxococcota bacterium]